MARTLSSDVIDRAEAMFREYLRSRALKYTSERRTLLLEVLRNNEHFEAEQLLISMRHAGKRIAKATIYRTLPLLVDCGVVKQVQFGEKLARYEHTFGQGPHDHMICLRCRRVIEFDSAAAARLRETEAARHRFTAHSHRFQIWGVCSQCR